MLLRDRLAARLAEMGDRPDHQRLVAEVLGVRNAPPALARRLVAQALVVENREAEWQRIGERICAAAPDAPAVYVLKDEQGRALYVGKAVRLRRRLRAHFAHRRWPALKADMARVVDAEWQVVGSELEALVREAALINELRPHVNVQTGPPRLARRAIPKALIREVIVVAPSVGDDSVELIAARPDGAWMIQRTRRTGSDLIVHTTRLLRFFKSPVWRARRQRARAEPAVDVAPIVFSWLAGRGAAATRLDPNDSPTRRDLADRLASLFRDEGLFAERIDQRGSRVRR
jgi:predicted GIY-YIG superfamily endonuclease